MNTKQDTDRVFFKNDMGHVEGFVHPESLSRNHFNTQSGVGIIEILIAVVVISFGVLGMAGLQLTGMKHSSSSNNRSLAVLFSENMAGRMRSNPGGVANLFYVDSDSQSANCEVRPNPYCQASVQGPANSCNAEQMAAFDVFSISCGTAASDGEFKDGLIDSLNNGRLVVECDDAPCLADSNYTITISWNEGRTTAKDESEDDKSMQMRLRP